MTGFKEEFDVLIVGAGPAGSFAAERIAREGARVALFDGRPASEAKACGGGVTSKALKAWPFLFEAGGRAVTEVLMQSARGRRRPPQARGALRNLLAPRARLLPARACASRGRARLRGRVSVSVEKDADGLWVVGERAERSGAGAC